MAEPVRVRVRPSLNRILVGVATLLMAISFCMCLGFILDKPKDLLDLLAVWAAAFTLYFLAALV